MELPAELPPPRLNRRRRRDTQELARLRSCWSEPPEPTAEQHRLFARNAAANRRFGHLPTHVHLPENTAELETLAAQGAAGGGDQVAGLDGAAPAPASRIGAGSRVLGATPERTAGRRLAPADHGGDQLAGASTPYAPNQGRRSTA